MSYKPYVRQRDREREVYAPARADPDDRVVALALHAIERHGLPIAAASLAEACRLLAKRFGLGGESYRSESWGFVSGATSTTIARLGPDMAEELERPAASRRAAG